MSDSLPGTFVPASPLQLIAVMPAMTDCFACLPASHENRPRGSNDFWHPEPGNSWEGTAQKNAAFLYSVEKPCFFFWVCVQSKQPIIPGQKIHWLESLKEMKFKLKDP